MAIYFDPLLVLGVPPHACWQVRQNGHTLGELAGQARLLGHALRTFLLAGLRERRRQAEDQEKSPTRRNAAEQTLTNRYLPSFLLKTHCY